MTNLADRQSYNSRDFSVETLLSAAKGESNDISPPLAIALLRAKLGKDAFGTLESLALDEEVGLAGRIAAVSALGGYPMSRVTLATLSRSDEQLVARFAARALRSLDAHPGP